MEVVYPGIFLEEMRNILKKPIDDNRSLDGEMKPGLLEYHSTATLDEKIILKRHIEIC
jgi:hypothetical protein